jgi:hypothetical protein
MASLHEQRRYEALKQELRRLRRPVAPWYFESELHRRLHVPHRRVPYVGVAPILIIASTIVTLSIAVYVTLVNPMLMTQHGSPAPAATAVPVASPDSQPTPAVAARSSDSAPAAVRLPRQKMVEAPAGRNAAAGGDSLRNRPPRTAAVRSVVTDSIPITRRQAPVAPAEGESPVPVDTNRVK